MINTGFTLKWCVEFSGNSDPLTYTIIGVSADKATHSYNAQTQQGSTVVTGQEPNATYPVQIRVSNALGEAVSNQKTPHTTCCKRTSVTIVVAPQLLACSSSRRFERG